MNRSTLILRLGAFAAVGGLLIGALSGVVLFGDDLSRFSAAFDSGGAAPGLGSPTPGASETSAEVAQGPTVEATAVALPTTPGNPAPAATCTIDVGDPSLWVVGATVNFKITVSAESGLPAQLSSNNGASTVITSTATVMEYGPLKGDNNPRIFRVQPKDGVMCEVSVTIIVPTETPTATPIPPTETPFPTRTSTIASTLEPIVVATATPGLPPDTGDGDSVEMPKDPMDAILEFFRWLVGR